MNKQQDIIYLKKCAANYKYYQTLSGKTDMLSSVRFKIIEGLKQIHQ